MNDRIRIGALNQGVAEVCLTRADKLNALDTAMFEALAQVLQHLRALPGLRAVVLHGEGKAFCAGLDMASLAAMAGGPGATAGAGLELRPRTHGIANRPRHVAMGWRELPVPVLANLEKREPRFVD